MTYPEDRQINETRLQRKLQKAITPKTLGERMIRTKPLYLRKYGYEKWLLSTLFTWNDKDR